MSAKNAGRVASWGGEGSEDVQHTHKDAHIQNGSRLSTEVQGGSMALRSLKAESACPLRDSIYQHRRTSHNTM